MIDKDRAAVGETAVAAAVADVACTLLLRSCAAVVEVVVAALTAVDITTRRASTGLCGYVFFLEKSVIFEKF